MARRRRKKRDWYLARDKDGNTIRVDNRDKATRQAERDQELLAIPDHEANKKLAEYEPVFSKGTKEVKLIEAKLKEYDLEWDEKLGSYVSRSNPLLDEAWEAWRTYKACLATTDEQPSGSIFARWFGGEKSELEPTEVSDAREALKSRYSAWYELGWELLEEWTGTYNPKPPRLDISSVTNSWIVHSLQDFEVRIGDAPREVEVSKVDKSPGRAHFLFFSKRYIYNPFKYLAHQWDMYRHPDAKFDHAVCAQRIMFPPLSWVQWYELQNELKRIKSSNSEARKALQPYWRRRSLLKQKEKEKLAEQKKAQHKALAAAHIGKTRGAAKSVRSKLVTDSDLCPYCFNVLGSNPHADHIYPVVRGGLSTEDNMIMVCESCNLKKKNMTLREFARTHNLNLERIESELELIGKRF